jgi:hypothetical protein
MNPLPDLPIPKLKDPRTIKRREGDIESKFVSWCLKRNIYSMKFERVGHDGWPDQQVIIPGREVLFVELKIKGKHPRPEQAKVHKFIRNVLLMRVEIVRGEEDFKKVLP